METNETSVQRAQQRKKSHGNRKDQRFRRKYRARGMKSNQIEKLLEKRKQANQQPNQIGGGSIARNTNQNKTETATITTTTGHNTSTIQDNSPSEQMMITIAPNLLKRKRNDLSQLNTSSNRTIPKSISSISITQPASKKMKKKYPMNNVPLVKINDEQINKNYRKPMYLKRSPTILFQMLKQKINLPLKGKNEQQFIYDRLSLFDQQYCLEIDLKLQQSSFDVGVQQHQWPHQLYTMTQTEDFHSCRQYLQDYIENLKRQLNECQIELIKQTESCSIAQLSVDRIDQGLKEYVDSQRKYLSIRNNEQFMNFKENIDLDKTLQSLSNYHGLSSEQVDFIHRLIHLRQQQSDSWKDLLMFELRILCKFLSEDCDHLEHFIAMDSYMPLNTDQKAIDFRNKRHKLIQEAKRNWLNISLQAYEIKIQDYEQQYQNEFNHLEIILSNSTINNHRSAFNSIKIYLDELTNELKRTISDQVSSSRHLLLQNRQRTASSKNTIGVSPEPYLDRTSNLFNQREWNYLCLGSSCIRMNQSVGRPKVQQEALIKKEHQSIFNKVQSHLIDSPHRVPRNNTIFKEYSSRLLNHINHTYSTPIPYKDQMLAYEQANIAQSIRNKIKQHKLILRVVDKGNSFYIGSFESFEEKVQKYFTDTNAFDQLSENPFNDILNRVRQTLQRMASKKLITQKQLNEMLSDEKTCELAHLYFNPKIHKEGIPIRPIQHSIHAPTAKISKFLDQLIRPVFDEKCKTTSIINGAHLTEELQKYTDKGLFKSSTLLCTFDIHNLYTMLPQEESLDILVEFLHVHGFSKVKGISLETIRELASIVLKENVFVYGKNVYRQKIGGAMGSSFTLTLANIFMWKWQKALVRQQYKSNEIFGRYIDDIFMTWNRSEEELRKLLDEANQWHPNIKLDYQIGQSLPFLDVFLMNQNGYLLTSIYHKPSAEPYVVPFVSDHPRHVFGNIIQGALMRAVRYSSTYQTFEQERRYIKLMLLYNRYPSSFIEDQFRKFFINYTSLTPFISHMNDETQFSQMRNTILRKPTTRQSQVALNAASIDIDNNQFGEAILQSKDFPVEAKPKQEKKKYEEKLIIHYTHEKRLESMKRDMHRVYDDTFQNTPVQDVKMIVGTRNRRDAKNDLIRKRPNRALLRNKLRPTRKPKTKHETTA